MEKVTEIQMPVLPFQIMEKVLKRCLNIFSELWSFWNITIFYYDDDEEDDSVTLLYNKIITCELL